MRRNLARVGRKIKHPSRSVRYLEKPTRFGKIDFESNCRSAVAERCAQSAGRTIQCDRTAIAIRFHGLDAGNRATGQKPEQYFPVERRPKMQIEDIPAA